MSDVKKLVSELEHREVTVVDLVELRDATGVPDGKRLEVTLRREPQTRAETKPRQHLFHDAESLAEWLRRYGTENATVYLDAPNGTASVVLNEKAEKGSEVLRLEPQTHPRWEPWKKLAENGAVDLDDFVDFLRDHRQAIKAPESRGLLLSLSQVKASTEVTLHRGHGNKALNGLLVKTRVGGTTGSGTDDVVDLPDKITVTAPIFVGDRQRDVELDVILDGAPDGRSVTVRLASADAKEAEIDAFEGIESALRVAAQDKGYAVVRGSPAFGAWTYNS